VCWPIRVLYFVPVTVARVSILCIATWYQSLDPVPSRRRHPSLPTAAAAPMAERPPLPCSGELFPPLPLSYKAALAAPPTPTCGATPGMAPMARHPAPRHPPPDPAHDPRRPRHHPRGWPSWPGAPRRRRVCPPPARWHLSRASCAAGTSFARAAGGSDQLRLCRCLSRADLPSSRVPDHRARPRRRLLLPLVFPRWRHWHDRLQPAIRETDACEDVRVLHVPTASQFANVFTKGLPATVFTKFRSSLNICSG
jgi:hypothetical protein